MRFLCKSKLFTSSVLEKLWPHGYSSIGAVNFESAAYVARYVMKKINGDLKEEHYQYTDDDGVIHNRTPEFNQMSRGKGIGKDWFDKYNSDIYPHGKCVVRGRETNTPTYYDRKYKIMDGFGYDELTYKRYLEGEKNKDDNTPERLAVKEQIAIARLKTLKRTIS